jgi:hypothetical protein
VALIANGSLGSRIEARFSIYGEKVMVMPATQLHLHHPGAIGLPFHGMRPRLPIVEISNDGDMFGFGRCADKIDRYESAFG